ncbi:hypothetical protein [Microbulbifer agarilyticus]
MHVLWLLVSGMCGLISVCAHAGEADYQLPWCDAAGGVAEYVLPDRTRVDCLTATHAVEFDFAPKWAEAIGQALYYASQTDRKAAVVLILRSPKDERYVRRIEAAVASAGVELDIWPLKDEILLASEKLKK